MFNNMIYMTLVMPVIAELIRLVKDNLVIVTKKVFEWFRGYNTVKITHEQNFAGACIGDYYTRYLISSVLQYVTFKKVYSEYMEYETEVKCTGSFAERMSALKLTALPTNSVNCEGFLIMFRTNTRETDEKKSIKRDILTIQSRKSVGEINEFIFKCFNMWREKNYPDVPEPQYFFDHSGVEQNLPKFTRYLFESEITFESICFPEKSHIISLVDKLENGEIKKLGLMLHGVPGCGKTSCIKAIANYTKRNIVSIKLSELESDINITQIFHDTMIRHGKNDYDIIKKDKRIYILEDVDADCEVVLKRGLKRDSVPLDLSSIIEAADKPVKPVKKSKITLSGILNALDGINELNGAILIMTTNHLDYIDPALYRPGRITYCLEMKCLTKTEGNKMIMAKYNSEISELQDNVISPALLESYIQQSTKLEDLKAAILIYQHNKA